MQSTRDQRIFDFKNAGQTFKDVSVLNQFTSGTSVFFNMIPGDWIYIASFLPFNHKYLRFEAPDTIPRTPIIQILSHADEWVDVVDQIDYTDGLRKNGVVAWVPNIDRQWYLACRSRIDIAEFRNNPNAPEIYDSYWMRIGFDTGNAFTLSHVGQKFSTDADLFAEYPILQNQTIMGNWKVGKTDWEDQALTAGLYISKDIVNWNLAFTNNQILDISALRSASVHKTANIIFSGLGQRNYAEEIKASAQAYNDAMHQDKWGLDVNANGRRDRDEITFVTTSRATR